MTPFPPSIRVPRHPSTPRRKVLVAGAVSLGLAGVALAVSVAGPHADAKPAATAAQASLFTVETVSPRTLKLARTVAASGSVSARDELLIGSDATGVRLVEVLVDVGARVRRGQLLARGDDSLLRQQLAQQEALIRQAQTELNQAASNLDRAERIKDSGVYSVEAVQTRRTAAESATAKLDLARAQDGELEVMLARTRIVAPVEGVISRRGATVGAVMQPGMELFRLIRDEQLEWLAELPAPALAQVQAGATARVQLDDGRVVEATVRMVAPTLDPHSRRGLAHVALPRGVALKAGGHASGEILVGNDEAMTLPESVIFVRDGENHVLLVGPDDIARRQRIQTGLRQHGLVQVLGLAADARVVSTGAGFVKDGERVHVSSQPGSQPVQQGASS